MVDFVRISTKINKGITEIYPKFIIRKSEDLMIRGSDFYAVWMEDLGLWSTDEQDVLRIIDNALDDYAETFKKSEEPVRVLHMWDAETGMIDRWHKYCQSQYRDSFHMLDEQLTFANTPVKKNDYVSKRLQYQLSEGTIESYDRLMSVLYDREERHKLEWAIGSIVSGDSKWIQKFIVLYGAMGTGKSTILNIIQKLFEGYYSVFDARALGSSSNSFALEAFRTNPLVAIQHDGDLSHIEDNTRLNSLVSHELMTVNEKFKSTYSSRFKCFLFMGTNKPVKITDAKSGLIRRLIDVSPSGNKVSREEYDALIKKIDFELGAIAYYCLQIYLSDPNAYDDYIPLSMMGASNDFFNFVVDSYHVFKEADGVSLKQAWEMYKAYCEYAKVPYTMSQRVFREELKNYFREYFDRYTQSDGTRVRSYYSGFRRDRLEENGRRDEKDFDDNRRTGESANSGNAIRIWGREFTENGSNNLSENLKMCPAQYATSEGIPLRKWDDCQTSLQDIDERLLHYVKPPINHIVIDFDEDELDQNVEAAEKWPPTYAELSKSGNRIHLHYDYTGDVCKLEKLYAKKIEIKTFGGKSSLRRKLTKWINLPIAKLSSGLPQKKEVIKINDDIIKNEKHIRNMILKNLRKEIHPDTTSSIDFIKKILDDAYESGISYDVTDMKSTVISFAAQSTHQASRCLTMVSQMKFKSKEPSIKELSIQNDDRIVFYDVEVFPNLFVLCWKFDGDDPDKVVIWINPSGEACLSLTERKLVGFNNRKYDNHILYGRIIGYDNDQLYKLSQGIVANDQTAMFGEAYDLSYTDIYDFASAGNKKSLKKLEIEMGIHHQELGLPWDQPVPEDMWDKVGGYCVNDVNATEAAFHYLEGDWIARQILADIAGMSVNDTTNTLTTAIIFGKDNRSPQNEFLYRDMSKPVKELPSDVLNFLREACPEMMESMHYGFEEVSNPSYLPYFPGYTFEYDGVTKKYVSKYRNEIVGEGGYVYAQPGVYGNVALLDIASMHPHSVIAECLLGPRYTKRFQDIVLGRVAIKHSDWNFLSKILDGKLIPYTEKIQRGEMKAKSLANGLKTPINSFYGLSSAGFHNPARDVRNKDNIVAKRGALFMVNLKHEVQNRGFTVAHIKTDSIKIPNATPEIIQFVMNYGKRYGYTFEHEATYDKMCLVNDAVYIAKYKSISGCDELYGYVPDENKEKEKKWTATGTQFAVPYVFKTLFSHEDILFEDLCETKSVKSAIYLDLNEDLEDGEHNYRFVGRIGQFCPMKPGLGAGDLVRDQNGKMYFVTGTKGYKWLESEFVKMSGLAEFIDTSYYDLLVSDAKKSLEEYLIDGGLDWFLSDKEYERGDSDRYFLPF